MNNEIFKKTVTVIIFSFLMFQGGLPVKGALFTSLHGTSVNLGEEGTLFGGGVSLSGMLPSRFMLPNFYPYADTAILTSVEDQGNPSETVRIYAPFSAGLSYSHRLFADRLFATAAGEAGLYYFRKEGPKQYGAYTDFSQTETINTWGPRGSINIGLLFILSQRTALFARAGYGTSLFSDERVEEGFLSGFCFRAGIRMTVSGKNRSLLYD